MNQLQKVFTYSGNQVRTIIKNDAVWFVAKDVCEILDIADARKAVQRLDEDERSLIPVIDSLGRKQETFIVNEPGLYALILGSRKQEARQFKRWITHEVIPTIRKTGGYVANDDLFVETYLKHADEQTKLLFRATLETVRKQNEQIAMMQPKADYFDALVDRRLLTNFRDTAKELKVKPKAFVEWLIDKKYIYRDQKGKLKPYAQYVPSLFELKEWERNGRADVQTLVTPKGRETFRILLQKTAVLI
ncbi:MULTISPECIES: phage antirepressor Ant [unclassified Anoxybacillus]|uniref:phage antirepressor Ant n=1 Tax=unclassified Anoxybacillus TaxID=2639704 RepID=UPI0002D68581|nr:MULTISPECIES: phage antirepressor Ant [unclassified Anoxybacillus]AXM88479.1 phage antirepressor Ant [Anoxybacillus ayderensis G10]MBW9219286.1 phage antirepressor Ant [Anoxybacillus sp. ST70]NNU96290.1 phage antirepressor Ant [Anoxybacillus sp. EFIL]